MKWNKTWLLATLVLIAAACSKEESIDTSADLSFDLANKVEYRGVFTTLDGSERATVFVVFNNGMQNPTAIFNFDTGKTIQVKGTRSDNLANSSEYNFANPQINFTLNTHQNALEATFSNVLYKDLEGDIIGYLHTERAPVTPINGTYECGTCNDHPVLGQGAAQTFNLVFVSAAGVGSITTQVTIGGVSYNDGMGYQDNCLADGFVTDCDIESGDGSTTTNGFLANGNPVTWTGVHTFNNEPTGPNDCSGVSGTWQWQSISYGLITGTFESTVSCFTDLAIQDFDGTTPEWTYTTSIPFFNAASGTDQFGISDGTTGGSSGDVDFENIIGNFLYVQDMNNSNGGSPGFVTTTFADISVSGRTNVSISFDYDVFEFDTGDDVEYILVLDGVDQSTVVLIDGLSNLSAEGSVSIPVPNGTTTVGLKLRIRQNGNDDYAGFDNFLIRGI